MSVIISISRFLMPSMAASNPLSCLTAARWTSTFRRARGTGKVLRLRGKGRPGVGDAPPGDALIEISMLPHPYFTRKGDDIYLDLPISLKEAVLATRIQVPTRAVRSRWLYQNGQTPVAFSG
jgi:DnaJ-class molecular chaperone